MICQIAARVKAGYFAVIHRYAYLYKVGVKHYIALYSGKVYRTDVAVYFIIRLYRIFYAELFKIILCLQYGVGRGNRAVFDSTVVHHIAYIAARLSHRYGYIILCKYIGRHFSLLIGAVGMDKSGCSARLFRGLLCRVKSYLLSVFQHLGLFFHYMVRKRTVIYQSGIIVISLLKIGKALGYILRLIIIVSALYAACRFFIAQLAVVYPLLNLPHIF